MSIGNAYAVILAGGGGTRLWPASRRKRPKQLLALGGTSSLLRAAVRRARRIFGKQNTLVVTAADQEQTIRRELKALPPQNILIEPGPKNTKAAVNLAVVHLFRRKAPDAVLAVLPADAFIGDEPAFARVVRTAVRHAGERI